MSKYPYNTAICEYLDSIGIDPRTVAIEDFDISGYNAFVLDSEGKKRLDVDDTRHALLERREWPSSEVASTAMTIYTTGKPASKEEPV